MCFATGGRFPWLAVAQNQQASGGHAFGQHLAA
jgi:hypothetical protein